MRPLILTVDDAKAVRLMVAQALSAFACEAGEATNGYNALFAMERALPDLILLDINMPVMGGLEMLVLMRSNPVLTPIPVIMLASRADHAILPKLASLGANDRLLKPFDEPMLLEKIRGVLRLTPIQPARP